MESAIEKSSKLRSLSRETRFHHSASYKNAFNNVVTENLSIRTVKTIYKDVTISVIRHPLLMKKPALISDSIIERYLKLDVLDYF